MNQMVLQCANLLLICSIFLLVLLTSASSENTGHVVNLQIGAVAKEKLTTSLYSTSETEPFHVCITSRIGPRWINRNLGGPFSKTRCDMGLHRVNYRIDNLPMVDIPILVPTSPMSGPSNWTLLIRAEDHSWIYRRTLTAGLATHASGWFGDGKPLRYYYFIYRADPQVTAIVNRGSTVKDLDKSSRTIRKFGLIAMADMAGVFMDILGSITVSMFYGIGVLRFFKYTFLFLNYAG